MNCHVKVGTHQLVIANFKSTFQTLHTTNLQTAPKLFPICDNTVLHIDQSHRYIYAVCSDFTLYLYNDSQAFTNRVIEVLYNTKYCLFIYYKFRLTTNEVGKLFSNCTITMSHISRTNQNLSYICAKCSLPWFSKSIEAHHPQSV